MTLDEAEWELVKILYPRIIAWAREQAACEVTPPDKDPFLSRQDQVTTIAVGLSQDHVNLV